MKKKCILHIGMAKTGTTSIQHTLDRSHNHGSIQYAKLGVKNHSIIIGPIFIEDPGDSRGLVRKGITKDTLAKMRVEYTNRIVDFIDKSTADTIIFSAEAFTNKFIGKNGAEKVRKFFEPYFESFHIVGYVRSPASAATSAAQQGLKAGRVGIGPIIPNYRQKFEPWVRTFSDQEITLRAWKRERFPEGNVVLDFANIVGIELGPRDLITQNESLCLEAVALLYAERNEGVDPIGSMEADRANHQMHKRLRKLKGRKFVLSENFLRTAIQSRLASIRWVEKYLGEEIMDEGSRDSWAIENPQDLLKIAIESEPALYEFVDRNIEPLNGVPKSRAELFHYLRHSKTKTKIFN